MMASGRTPAELDLEVKLAIYRHFATSPSRILSRCEQSLEPLLMEVGADGPGPSDWLFHCLVPAARWWEDIVFT